MPLSVLIWCGNLILTQMVHYGPFLFFDAQLHFTIRHQKIMNNYGKKGLKEKKRDICYSSHHDRCIYQYYAYLLNLEYNLNP